MNRRRKNNIVIGTLCAVLVLMGVGYAILNTTLNIGGTANIKGDFDIHFTRIQRSSSTISDTALLNTMDNGTGITENTSNHEGTFTAVLQKPTDYVIYEVEVANTGSIDGYLTFTFGDKHNIFDYYKDFYSVEFIRDDVDPDISTDILQPNATFTDNEVLVNTTGTRTYKIKVTFKESATGFPDATTNGDFECTLNLTYSQQAPGGNSGDNTESNLTWYATNDNTLAFALDGDKVIKHLIYENSDIAADYPGSFEQYDSTMDSLPNFLGQLQSGDYVWVAEEENDNVVEKFVFALLRNDIIYFQLEPGDIDEPILELERKQDATLEDFLS